MAWFQCRHTITGEASGFNLTKPLVSVGRASNNDLVLADPMIGKSQQRPCGRDLERSRRAEAGAQGHVAIDQ